MKNFFTILILVITVSTAKSQSDSLKTTPDSFEAILDSAKLVFTPPKGYTELVPIENNQMNYEKAYKHPTEKFEVRYAIRTHKFGFFDAIFQVTILNISGGQSPEYSLFNTEAVKEEFNADIGASVMINPSKEFAADYKYCLMVCINKKGVGDAFYFYLADDNTLIQKLMLPIFHALKFEE